MPEISEKENASIEISQIDQDIEQEKTAEFNPDEIIEISEDENLTSTPVSSSNKIKKIKILNKKKLQSLTLMK